MRTAQCFAHFSEQRGWCYASKSKLVSQLLWEGDPLIQVMVHEDPEGKYWAWWENEDQSFNYLSSNINMVKICFPYGPGLEQARGRGELLRVSVIVMTGEESLDEKETKTATHNPH